MQYELAWLVVAIFFWVLCAAAIVIGLAWVFCYCNYFKWDKEDRLKKEVMEKVGEMLDDKNNLGGGNNDIGF